MRRWIIIIGILGGAWVMLSLGMFQKVIRFFRKFPRLPGVPPVVYNSVQNVLKSVGWVDPYPYPGFGGRFRNASELHKDVGKKIASLEPSFAKKIYDLYRELLEWCIAKWEGKIYPAIFYATRPLGLQSEIAYLGYTKTLKSKHIIGRAVDIYPYSFGYGGYYGWVNELSPLWNKIVIKGGFKKKLDELAKKYNFRRISWDIPHIEDRVSFDKEIKRLGLSDKFYLAVSKICEIKQLKGKSACA